jgi:TonB family protein
MKNVTAAFSVDHSITYKMITSRVAAGLVFLSASQIPFSEVAAIENAPDSLIRKQLLECASAINRQENEKFEDCLARQISIDRSSPAIPSSFHITFDDYPNKALKKKISGQSKIILKIDEAGKVFDCEVSRSSGHKDLDSRACAISLKRGLFSPATDTYGTPIRSTYEYEINWRYDLKPAYVIQRGGSVSDEDYPSSMIRQRKSGLVATSFSVNQLGKVENCKIVLSSGFSELDEESCRLITRRFRYKPATDRMGAPIKSDNIYQSINYIFDPNPRVIISDTIFNAASIKCSLIKNNESIKNYQNCLLEQIRLHNR